MAHRSTPSLRASRLSFFMRELEVGVGVRQLWPWLAEPEPEPPEQPLALTRPDSHSKRLRQESRERLTVPDVCRQTEIGGAPPQC